LQVLWHFLILLFFLVLKVSPTFVLVALLKKMCLLMAPFSSQQLNPYRAIYGPQVFLGFVQA
jgi:hypothetical protein